MVLMFLTSGLGTAVAGIGPVPTGTAWDDTVVLDDGALASPGPLEGRPSFIVNEGQFGDDDVVLYGKLSRGGIAFKAGSVLINQETSPLDGGSGTSPPPSSRDPADLATYRKALETTVTGCTLELTFEGSNHVVPRGEGALPGTHNYFLGGDAGGITGVRTFSRVVYEELYTGIDLVYLVTDAGLKYEFRVGPGADPSEISVHVEGHGGLRLADGDLVIDTGLADVRDTGLDVFYADGASERLRARFRVGGPETYGFVVEDRDPGRAVVIDPLVFSTYLGSSGWESPGDVLVDDEGYVYITGYSDGKDFPTTPGAYQEDNNNFPDVFVMKMAPDGGSLVWSTFIGGTDADVGLGLTVDGAGSVYVCGYTYSDNYPTTRGAFQSKTMGNGDGFVSKVSADGSRLLASTMFGGFWGDPALGIAVDGDGNMYVTGSTESTDFPTTTGAHDQVFNDSEAFVTKINSTATDLVYSTYLGGSGADHGNAILVDVNGSAYAVGRTRSLDFPTTQDGRQVDLAGQTDGFVVKVGPDGTALEASTYLGGQWFDEAMALAMDPGGDVHVFGNTRSDDFPVTAGAFQTTISTIREDDDAFATRMSWDLSTIRTSTFIGGDAEDYCPDGTLDVDGNVVIGGYTASSDFPTTDGAYQTQKGAFNDGFITKLSADYSRLLYSSHIGSVDTDEGVAVGAYGTLNIYLLGETFSDRFPTTPGAFQTEASGNRDIFLSMFSLDLVPPVAVAGPDVVIDQHETVQFNGSDSWDNEGVVNWTWSFDCDGAPVRLFGPAPSWTFDEAGECVVTLQVTDGGRHKASDTMNVTVVDITAPVADAGLSRTIRQGETLTLDGSGSTDNVGIENWTWSFTYFGEEVVIYGPVAEFTFARAGVFGVLLTVRDAVGLNASDDLTVTVLDLSDPIANAGEDVYVDQHEPAELDGSLSSDTTAIVNWTWSFVHAGIPMEVYGEVTSFTFAIAGVYEVRLRVFDDAGNFAMDTVTVHVRDSTPPDVDAGPDQTVDEGTTVRFDGSGSLDNVAIVSYGWSLEYDGQPVLLEGVSPTHRFDLPGIYPVTLTAADAEANSAGATVTVTVRDVTPPTAVAGEDRVVDEGTEVALDGSSSDDNVAVASWTWSFEYDGAFVTLEGEGPAFTFSVPGDFVVTLTVEDAAGHSATDVVLVTVRDITPPEVRPGPDRTVDQGTEVLLDASPSTDNVGITSYVWSLVENGVPVTLTGVVQARTFDVPGTYQVTLTLTDAAGNQAEAVLLLRVMDTQSPVPAARVDREVQLGDTVHLDASSSSDNVGIVSWTWTFRDGGEKVTLEGERVVYEFKEAGEHRITLTVEDADGNRATDDYTVTVRGTGWPYILFALVVVGAACSALYMMRRRGGGPATEEE